LSELADSHHSLARCSKVYSIVVVVSIVVSFVGCVASMIPVRGDVTNFFVAGRTLPRLMVTATLSGVVIDSNNLLGNADPSYKFSFWDGAVLPLGVGHSLILNAVVLAHRINKEGVITLPDLLARRYGKTVEPIVRLASVRSFVVLLAGNLVGLGNGCGYLWGISTPTAIAIVATIIWSYTISGVMYTTTNTGIAQGIAACTGSAALAFYVIRNEKSHPPPRSIGCPGKSRGRPCSSVTQKGGYKAVDDSAPCIHQLIMFPSSFMKGYIYPDSFGDPTCEMYLGVPCKVNPSQCCYNKSLSCSNGGPHSYRGAYPAEDDEHMWTLLEASVVREEHTGPDLSRQCKSAVDRRSQAKVTTPETPVSLLHLQPCAAAEARRKEDKRVEGTSKDEGAVMLEEDDDEEEDDRWRCPPAPDTRLHCPLRATESKEWNDASSEREAHSVVNELVGIFGLNTFSVPMPEPQPSVKQRDRKDNEPLEILDSPKSVVTAWKEVLSPPCSQPQHTPPVSSKSNSRPDLSKPTGFAAVPWQMPRSMSVTSKSSLYETLYGSSSCRENARAGGSRMDRQPKAGQETVLSTSPHNPHAIPNKTSLKRISSVESRSGSSCLLTLKRNVSFHQVEIREYSVAISDHPNCSSGPPVQLGWDYRDRAKISVNLYESHRPPRRCAHDMILSYNVRRFLLLHLAGYSTGEIRKAMKEVDRVKRNRWLTDLLLPASAIEEILEETRLRSKQIFSV
jgi:Sodium:solute symporter family